MKRIAAIFLVCFVIVAFASLCLVPWTFTYTEGNVGFVSIGQSKDKVLNELVSHGVAALRLIPWPQVVVRSPDQIDKLSDSVSIIYFKRIIRTLDSNSSKSSATTESVEIDIRFSGNVVSYLRVQSAGSQSTLDKVFAVGEGREDVLGKLANLLDTYPGSIATNELVGNPIRCLIKQSCVGTAAIHDLGPGETDELRLMIADQGRPAEDALNYDAWNYQVVRGMGSDEYWVYFRNNRLDKVVIRKIIIPIFE